MAPLGSEVTPEGVAETSLLVVVVVVVGIDNAIPSWRRKNAASAAGGKGEHDCQDGEDQGKDEKKGGGGDGAVMMMGGSARSVGSFTGRAAVVITITVAVRAGWVSLKANFNANQAKISFRSTTLQSRIE